MEIFEWIRFIVGTAVAIVRFVDIRNRNIRYFPFEICLKPDACSGYGRYFGNQHIVDRAYDIFRH